MTVQNIQVQHNSREEQKIFKLMEYGANNSAGYDSHLEVWGVQLDGKREYMLTLDTKKHPECHGNNTQRTKLERTMIQINAETIANMQKCVEHYRELWPELED
jgi:hypothetical protein